LVRQPASGAVDATRLGFRSRVDGGDVWFQWVLFRRTEQNERSAYLTQFMDEALHHRMDSQCGVESAVFYLALGGARSRGNRSVIWDDYLVGIC